MPSEDGGRGEVTAWAAIEEDAARWVIATPYSNERVSIHFIQEDSRTEFPAKTSK